MSQENVEALRAFLETWSREPWTLEAWERAPMIDLSLLDPDVVYEDTTLPDHIGEAYRGHEGIIRAAKRWVEPFESLLVELDEIVDAGDRIVSTHRGSGNARFSGIDLGGPVAYVWTFRAGKVIHFKSYREVPEALEAAGLSE